MTKETLKQEDLLAKQGHTPISYTSLKHFKRDGIKGFVNYKNRLIEEESSDSQDLGTLIDTYLLDPDQYKENYFVSEASTPSSSNQKEFADLVAAGSNVLWAYRQCYKTAPKSDEACQKKVDELLPSLEEYIKEFQLRAEKIPISEQDSFTLGQIRTACVTHPVVVNWLPGMAEQDDVELLTHLSVTGEWQGLPIKGEIDIARLDHKNKTGQIADLKSTHKGPSGFDYDFFSYRYDEQLFVYQVAFRDWMAERYPDYRVLPPRALPVQTRSPYYVGLKRVPTEAFVETGNRLREVFEQIKWHYENEKFDFTYEVYHSEDNVETINYRKDLESWIEELEQNIETNSENS